MIVSDDFCFRWKFDPSNPTAHAAWSAFYHHRDQKITNSQTWTPKVLSGINFWISQVVATLHLSASEDWNVAMTGSEDYYVANDTSNLCYCTPNKDKWWTIILISWLIGPPPNANQDSFMYRIQNGVRSLLLDDDNCDCYTTLSMGHGMCLTGFSTSYGPSGRFGVDLLYDTYCQTPDPKHGLTLYFKGLYIKP